MTVLTVKTNRNSRWTFADTTVKMKLITDQFSDLSELLKQKNYRQKKKPKD